MSRYGTPSAPKDSPLFAQPRARATDPQTSHEAAARHAPEANTNAWRILTVVNANQGLTSVEIHRRLAAVLDWPMERHEVSRRLSDLAREGHVRKGEARKCRVKGTNMTTWWPAEVTP